MQLTPFEIILYFTQFTALATAALYYKQYKKTAQRHFLYFLLFVVSVEVSGAMLSSFDNGEQGFLKQLTGLDSRFVYNIYTIGSLLFFLYWFSKILDKHNLLVSIFALLFGLSVVYCVLVYGFYDQIWILPILTGGIFTIFCSCLWYAQKLTSEEAFDFVHSQQFWIVTGLLIFHLGIIPLLYFQNYVIRSFPLSYGSIILTLNLILYGSITFSFLCLRKK